MSALEPTEVAQVTLGGTATVPAKYAVVITLMNSDNSEVWQSLADEWVKGLRKIAAEAGMEVDDLLATMQEEAARQGKTV